MVRAPVYMMERKFHRLIVALVGLGWVCAGHHATASVPDILEGVAVKLDRVPTDREIFVLLSERESSADEWQSALKWWRKRLTTSVSEPELKQIVKGQLTQLASFRVEYVHKTFAATSEQTLQATERVSFARKGKRLRLGRALEQTYPQAYRFKRSIATDGTTVRLINWLFNQDGGRDRARAHINLPPRAPSAFYPLDNYLAILLLSDSEAEYGNVTIGTDLYALLNTAGTFVYEETDELTGRPHVVVAFSFPAQYRVTLDPERDFAITRFEVREIERDAGHVPTRMTVRLIRRYSDYKELGPGLTLPRRIESYRYDIDEAGVTTEYLAELYEVIDIAIGDEVKKADVTIEIPPDTIIEDHATGTLVTSPPDFSNAIEPFGRDRRSTAGWMFLAVCLLVGSVIVAVTMYRRSVRPKDG